MTSKFSTTLVHYIIRPNDKLLELSKSKGDMSILLTTPMLWSIETLRGRFLLSSRKQPLELKLAFIAYLKTERGRSDNKVLLQYLDELLIPPLGVETFDKWWFIEQIQLSESFSWVRTHADIDVLTSLAKTGNPVADEWLDWVINERMYPNTENE